MQAQVLTTQSDQSIQTIDLKIFETENISKLNDAISRNRLEKMYQK